VADISARPVPVRLVRSGREAPGRPVQPPLSLYVHIPWCVRKCPYCDFNSHAIENLSDLPQERYLAALLADLESVLPDVWGRTVHSIFIGGGTPSLLTGEALGAFLSQVRARLPLAGDCEITVEANPGTFEAGRYAAFRDAGVNRLSIGVQSFDDASLQALGRVHDAAQARHAIAAARDAFENFNIDLMCGLPGQTPDQARADVLAALEFSPPHLSVYQLTLEPNTVFAKYPPILPDEDALVAIQDAVEDAIAQAGLHHYEVSAFSRPGRACRHNLNYWRFGDYLGIGAGAHAKVSMPGGIVRTERYRHPDLYMTHAQSGRFVALRRELSGEDLVFEFMLNALRLRDGFEGALFSRTTGFDLARMQPVLDRAASRGLLEQTHERIRPTALGMRFLNDLQEMFLPSAASGPQK
jgi:putative oxygen-independent coproporphyrinogen III oxidase